MLPPTPGFHMTSSAILAATLAPPGSVPVAVWVLMVAAGIVATVTDIRWTIIPNWLTIPLLTSGLAFAFLTRGLPGLGDSLGGAAFAGAIFIGAYVLAGGGAGDAKMMLGLGAWTGFWPSVVLLFCVAIAGFIEAIGATIIRGGVRDVPYLLMIGWWKVLLGGAKLRAGRLATTGPLSEPLPAGSQRRERPKHWYPYAPAILVGTLAAWWWIEVGSSMFAKDGQ